MYVNKTVQNRVTGMIQRNSLCSQSLTVAISDVEGGPFQKYINHEGKVKLVAFLRRAEASGGESNVVIRFRMTAGRLRPVRYDRVKIGLEPSKRPLASQEQNRKRSCSWSGPPPSLLGWRVPSPCLLSTFFLLSFPTKGLQVGDARIYVTWGCCVTYVRRTCV